MNRDDIRDWLQQLRSIPLESVLLETGAHRDPQDKAKWRTAQGAISVTGIKFMNWNQGRGGGGAIDLAMHLNNLDFTAALDWLGRHFQLRHYSPPQLAVRRFLPPPPDGGKLTIVKRYLVEHRGIALSLIESLVDTGRLYADARANAVFMLLGKDNPPVGAELRGTATSVRWRGMAPGSRKDLGFFSVDAPNPTIIVLCESAIDAMSCSLLYPSSSCVSTSGARPNLSWLPLLLSQPCPVYCGFDADPTGDTMAQHIISRYPKVRRLRPTQPDWNDVLRSRPSF